MLNSLRTKLKDCRGTLQGDERTLLDIMLEAALHGKEQEVEGYEWFWVPGGPGWHWVWTDTPWGWRWHWVP